MSPSSFALPQKILILVPEYKNSRLPSAVKQLLYSLHRAYRSGYSLNNVVESTLIKDAIIPLIEPFLPNSKKYTTHGGEGKIKSSDVRFRDVDPSLSNFKKGDYAIVSSNGHLILSLEAKAVKHAAKSREVVKKMARYLKDTLVKINEEGFGCISAIGIIASGPEVSIFIMNQSYDYIHTLLKMITFYVPIGRYDLFRIVPIVSAATFVRNCVTAASDELFKLQQHRGKQKLYCSLQTYHTPTEVPGSRVKKLNINAADLASARRKLWLSDDDE